MMALSSINGSSSPRGPQKTKTKKTMRGFGYSNKTRLGFKRCDALNATRNFSLMCRMAERFHSPAFIEELRGMQAMINTLSGNICPDKFKGDPWYFSTDSNNEAPVTPYVIAQQVNVAQRLEAYAQWIISQGFPLGHHCYVANPYPTHHATMDAPSGFCLINWRNILYEMLSSDSICGGMDMDVHATGNGDQSIFDLSWKGRSQYHHYVDFTSVDIYPNFFEIKLSKQGKKLFYCNDKKQREALPHECYASSKGNLYFVHTCQDTNTTQVVFNENFDPDEYVDIICQFNNQRLVRMVQCSQEANQPRLDLMHIGMDAMRGDSLGNQLLTAVHFDRIASNHRALCDKYGIPTVSFSEGGYSPEAKSLFQSFFKSLGAECMSSVVRQKPEFFENGVQKIDEFRFRDPITGLVVRLEEQQGILKTLEQKRLSMRNALRLVDRQLTKYVTRHTFGKDLRSIKSRGMKRCLIKKQWLSHRLGSLKKRISLLSGTILSFRSLPSDCQSQPPHAGT